MIFDYLALRCKDLRLGKFDRVDVVEWPNWALPLRASLPRVAKASREFGAECPAARSRQQLCSVRRIC
jgi:hypothetical protein